MNEISTKKMIDSGVIVPVEDLIKKDPSFDKKKLFPQVLNYYSKCISKEQDLLCN